MASTPVAINQDRQQLPLIQEGRCSIAQGWVFAMAKTIFAGTVEKTGKNRGEN